MKKGIFLLIGIAIYIIFFAGFVHASFNKDSEMDNLFETIQVNSGDTLWNIADRYNDDKGVSLLKMLDLICEQNKIDGAKIYPGQYLKIPK